MSTSVRAAEPAHPQAIAGDAFDGVRVIAHFAAASSVHVLPGFSDHRIGECAKCETRAGAR